MTQRFSFWDDLTIAENLDFVARMYQIRDRRRVVRDSLAALGLAARAHQLAGELSGGWKQRMALAACMLARAATAAARRADSRRRSTRAPRLLG